MLSLGWYTPCAAPLAMSVVLPEANSLLHCQKTLGFGDAGYRGIEKRLDTRLDVIWHIAMQPGKRKKLNKSDEADALLDQAEKLKASVRAKVE